MDCPDIKPSAEQEKIIQRALSDTIQAIKVAAITKFEGDGVKTDVLTAALEQWKHRYYCMFAYAVVILGRTWDGPGGDKDQVLDRARQVGVIAANFAAIKAVIVAWIRGDLQMGGQNVHIKDAPMPEVTVGMAELASLCIDCKAAAPAPPPPGKVSADWDWCSSSLSPGVLGGGPLNVHHPPQFMEKLDFLWQEAKQDQILIAERLMNAT